MKWTHSAVQLPAASAEPRLRAGFMLIPESGDSTRMYVATSSPPSTPV